MTTRGRYDGLPTATLRIGEREVAYVPGRTPIAPAASPPVAWHRVRPDDRLDLLAARYLGDPGAAWRIADANLALDPDALVGAEGEGRVIAIPGPGV